MTNSNLPKELNKNTKISQSILGVALVLIVAALVFFFVYFHVDTVEVMGSSYYSQEEIESMVLRGPLAKNSVLAPVLYSKENLDDTLFLHGIEVSRVNNHTICISVQETQPVGCIKYLDCYMYFDNSGAIVFSSVERDMRIPFFQGMDMPSVALGDEVPFTDEKMLSTSISLSRIFSKNDSIPNYISVDSTGNISILYGEIMAQLGSEKFLEDKMTRLIAILPKISGQKGILHLENVTDTKKIITFEKELTPEEQAALDAEDKQGETQGEEDSSLDSSDSSWDSGDDNSDSSDDNSDSSDGSWDSSDSSWDSSDSDYNSGN